MTPLRIFIGWDSREDIAYQVARFSLLRHTSLPIDVQPIKQVELREKGLYTRDTDPLASTEFTYTRFLTPYLAGYQGWAMFVDCDFVYTGDIAELFELCDPSKALMCVQHDHRPTETVKMDGAVQTSYPRKNWSSMTLYNCGHPANKVLTPELVSRESGAFLHRFQWLSDDLIAGVPATWNWLEGSMEKPANGKPPKAVHHTRGGPWFDNWQHVDYGDLWCRERDIYLASVGQLG